MQILKRFLNLKIVDFGSALQYSNLYDAEPDKSNKPFSKLYFVLFLLACMACFECRYFLFIAWKLFGINRQWKCLVDMLCSALKICLILFGFVPLRLASGI